MIVYEYIGHQAEAYSLMSERVAMAVCSKSRRPVPAVTASFLMQDNWNSISDLRLIGDANIAPSAVGILFVKQVFDASVVTA